MFCTIEEFALPLDFFPTTIVDCGVHLNRPFLNPLFCMLLKANELSEYIYLQRKLSARIRAKHTEIGNVTFLPHKRNPIYFLSSFYLSSLSTLSTRVFIGDESLQECETEETEITGKSGQEKSPNVKFFRLPKIGITSFLHSKC